MTLTIPQRRTIARYRDAGVSHEAIAAQFGINVAAVVRIERAGRVQPERRPLPEPKLVDWRSAPPAREMYRASDGCKFPLGDPRQDGFGFCGHRRLPGYPYCTAHCAISYRNFQCEAAA